MNNKSDFDQLIEQLDRYPSLDKLHLQRNLGLGGGLASFVLLVEILSVGLDSNALKVSLLACAVAIPLLIGMAGLVEYYIVLGPKSYGHRRTALSKNLISLLFLSGGGALITASGAALYHLLPLAAYVFGATIFVTTVIAVFFQRHLAQWYFSDSVAREALPSDT